MKRTCAILVMVLTIAVLIHSVSLAWISDNGLSSVISISGAVRKNYFAYGEGTETDPYGIATPGQLYYFAWLQYLGFFNVDENDDKVMDTFYFELDPNLGGELDMKGYTLPPIGTIDNPFLGNFNGNGVTISNLTVKNFYGALSAPPSGTDSDSFGGADIIGFFGVVGSLPNPTYTYTSETNVIKNLALKNFTIETQSEKNTLIGVVAGYVNGTVNGVGVLGGTITIKEGLLPLGPLDQDNNIKNLSDYSLIGYCTKEYRKNIHTLNLSLTAPGSTDEPYNIVPDMTGEGQQQGWGGSIAMKSIFEMIQGLDTTANSNYITERVDVVSLDGKKTVTVDRGVKSRDTATLKDGELIDNETGNPFTFGSFVFTTTSYSGNEINFINGSTKVTQIKYKETQNSVPLYYITDGTYYLCYNNGNITSTTDPNQATPWYVSNGANGGSVYIVVDGEVLYLTVENGTLTASTADPTNPPSWSVSGNTYALNGQNLMCDNGVWKIADTYKIASGNDYLVNNGTNIVRGDASSTTVWKITAVDGGYTVSTEINGTPYYLAYTTSSSGWQTRANLDSALSATKQSVWQFNGTQLYVEVDSGWFGTTTYRLQYSNNSWSLNNGNTNTTVTSATNASVDINSSGKTASEITVTTTEYIDNDLENSYYDESGKKVPTAENSPAGITYIPLSFEYRDEEKEYTVLASNTGYIVGSEWDETTYDDQDGEPSNLRISQYQKSSINNPDKPYIISYKDKKFTELTSTINPKDKGLVKYESCYGEYLSSLEQNCYGLHFMNAPIFKDNVVEITAYLNGRQIPNYQVPTNCIDFNLYERGFINAFAGTYYTNGGGNTSFFSLYEVIRDPDDETKIKEIKEIQSIYAALKNNEIDTSKEYIYAYTDGTSSGDIPAGYEEVFDCDWIMHTKTYCNNGGGVWTNNRSYYFEIPVNAGEYALGSTQGETGAYLVYLDLAANAQLIQREKTYEEITESSASSTIPNGVDFIAPGEAVKSDEKKDYSDSAFVTINKGTSGSIEYDKDGNVISHSATSGTTAEYVGVNGTLFDGNDNIMTVPWDSVTKIIRTTYRDYNVNTGVSTVTVIDEIHFTEGDTTTVKYTKDVTITNPDGSVERKPAGEPQEGLLRPDTIDKEGTSPELEAGEKLIDITFSHFSDVELTVSYLYTPAVKDENGNVTTAPKYVITILNGGTNPVDVKAVLTEAGVSSNITFVISDGTTENTLTKTTNPQFITINPSTTGGESGGEGGQTP